MNRFEEHARSKGYTIVAGIDEAGRGPLAGPVVAAAVIFPSGYKNDNIRDSKKLSPQKRENLYKVIKQDAVSIGTGIVHAEKIDAINILNATLLAMQKAVQNLSSSPDFLLIDGINEIKSVTIPQQTIIKGDSLSVSIGAASIIAKVTRDRIMDDYHQLFAVYNFKQNKGYGTKEHREALRQHGYSAIHRKSFKLKECYE